MPVPGEMISHYKILSSIGEGGMGEVFLAEDPSLSRKVAIKVLLSEVAKDEDRVQRFYQEAKAASALNHPNILTVFEVGNFEGSHYIVTEYIAGKTLREMMTLDDLSLSDGLSISTQTAAALSAAHDAGIIHRDVKPENIMIRGDGLVKVLDFGLAKLTEKRTDVTSSDVATRQQLITKPGIVVGTVAYMSPEQAKGRTLDARSDIFSLGIVIYELFTGKRPFEGEGQFDLISSILKDEPVPLCDVSPNLPEQLGRIVEKSLRKDRENRYQHIKDLKIDLDDLRDDIRFEAKTSARIEKILTKEAIGSEASTARSTLTTGIVTVRRFTVLHFLIFFVLALSAIAAIWYYAPGFIPPPEPGSYKTTEVANWTSATGEIFSQASFSPDGKMIAFSSTRSGSKNIWVTQTASANALQVTNDEFSNGDPIWSPKGDEVAYLSARGSVDGSKGTATGIWRVPALGGQPVAVATLSDGSGELLRWTNSGRIYIQNQGELQMLDITSGAQTRVTNFEHPRFESVDISLDEKQLVYSYTENNKWFIKSSDISGDKVKDIVSGEGKLRGVRWNQTDNRLYYGAEVDGVIQIFMTIIGSDTSRRITATETDSTVVDVSPDGESLIYSSAKEESNLWRVSTTDGREAPMIRDTNAKIWPVIAADNRRVAFQSIKNLSNGNKLTKSSIVVKDLRAGNDNERPALLSENGFLPSWSPDGKTVAFLRAEGKSSYLNLVNANGGGERKITGVGLLMPGWSVTPYNALQNYVFSWSPDGTSIAYTSDATGASNLYTVNIANGVEEKLTDNTDSKTVIFCPIWSDDGKNIAAAFHQSLGEPGKATRRTIKVIQVATRDSTLIAESEKLIRLIGWTQDNNALIVGESSREFAGIPPETKLRKIPINGGHETLIANLKNIYFYNIFLSYDKKSLAYAARESNMDDIWLLPVVGGSPKQLTDNNDSGFFFSRLAWVPDGSEIVFGKQTRFSILSLISEIK